MNDKITFISRAHGYDVYDSLYDPPFMPFRSVFLNNIDRLFVISSDGYNFISSKYGFHSKISISRLGTICNSNYVTFKENNFEFTFVSASNLYQLKNVPRLIRLLKEIACLNKLYVFNWHHFGDGPEYDIVLKETTTIPPNFRCFLHGRVPNSSIHNFYSSYYVDIFFNVSKSEGIPVSIMEALSYGIPVVAPDVGGVREIINNSVGILLEPSFSDTDFVEYVSAILSKKKGFVFDRSVIRSFWASNFSAVVNYTNFANEVMQIKPT
jgi:glycosyltransferase involved in cell wall biosynthesis